MLNSELPEAVCTVLRLETLTPSPARADRLRSRRLPSCGDESTERLHNMVAKALSFDVGDYVVYPKHGVGRVVELQKQEIAGLQLELYVLRFEKEKMTLRVPTNQA